jgi:2-polyprenyl-3-methyl-5-hydroxy-6-metoxy-1,4-benzoquinol methylase
VSTCLLCSAPVEVSAALAWRKDGHDIVRCPSCGLVYRNELPDEDVLSEIYDGAYFRDSPDDEDRHGYADYLQDAPLHRANARRRLRLLAARQAGRGRLLDVGCAAGFFIDEARAAGWDASGVDVSDEMVRWAETELALPVARGTLRDLPAGDPPFDVITMWDYIEHAIDPRRDLVLAAERLRPGGLVALSTGDVGSLCARVSGRRWHLLTPEHHNFFFSRRTLVALLEQTGFEVLEARRRASLYSLSHVVYKLGSSSSRDAVRRTASRVGRSGVGQAGIPLNLFDIVTVVARRR